MSTRKELLKLAEDGIKSIKLPFKIKKEQKSLESWILDYEEKVAMLDSEVMDLKCDENLDVDKILDKIDEKELAARRLSQGQDLMDELFCDIRKM